MSVETSIIRRARRVQQMNASEAMCQYDVLWLAEVMVPLVNFLKNDAGSCRANSRILLPSLSIKLWLAMPTRKSNPEKSTGARTNTCVYHTSDVYTGGSASV